MGVRRSLAAVALGLALAGCSAADDEPDVDVEGNWVLVSGRTADGPLDVPPGSRISLSLTQGSAGGKAPCNDYGSDYEVRGGDFALTGDGMSMTFAGCDGTLGELETAYLSTLGEVDTVSRDGDELVLRGTKSELVFASTPSWPRAEVIGHTWWLVRWTDDTGIEHRATEDTGGLPSVRLDMKGRRGGPITATSGCRTMKGHWSETGGQPTVTRSGWKGDCLHFTDQARTVESMMFELVLEMRETGGQRELVVRDAHGASGTELVYRR